VRFEKNGEEELNCKSKLSEECSAYRASQPIPLLVRRESPRTLRDLAVRCLEGLSTPSRGSLSRSALVMYISLLHPTHQEWRPRSESEAAQPRSAAPVD
jgi:hypothetical protein